MKKSAAELAVFALEQLGITYTFGIPGVHNTEIYDALNSSAQIRPILVTHEGGAAFMADGLSRMGKSVGTLVIVPAAGATHAMSGMGEAFLDGIPMLVISGGTRRDSGRAYQLHQIDQQQLVGAVVKKYYLIEDHASVIPTLYEAYEVATSGEPGPVFIEIPAELQMFPGEVSEMPAYVPPASRARPAYTAAQLESAAALLADAKHPGIFVGWGAVDATDYTTALAELLVAPVATSLQGISAMPANHPLHAGFGFGPAAAPAARQAFKDCDCLLAVGVRFGELATGSFGVEVPENLIHIDINPEVFHKNYPAKVTLEGDAREVLQALLEALRTRSLHPGQTLDEWEAKISKEKARYLESWLPQPQADKVSPGHFFTELRKQLPDSGIMVTDDGKHTFLSAELFPVYQARHFISPTDFNCMGYCVPAAIGAKLANPDQPVAAIVGDGAFLMTGMELLTAQAYGAGIMVFVFHDGELGQISQFQKIPLNRKTCTVLSDFKVEGVAQATGCHFISMNNDHEIAASIAQALEISAQGRPVLIDVRIDYSKKSAFTKGVVKTNLSRFTTQDKIRMLTRAAKRHFLG